MPSMALLMALVGVPLIFGGRIEAPSELFWKSRLDTTARAVGRHRHRPWRIRIRE